MFSKSPGKKGLLMEECTQYGEEPDSAYGEEVYAPPRTSIMLEVTTS